VDEYRLVARDGSTVWIRDEAAPVRGDDGTLLYWRGVMLDITERKEAEEKLRRSLEILYRTLRQRRELARRLQHAQEQERRGIAADIHDDPIQVMSAVDVRLQVLAADPASISPATIGEIRSEIRGAIERLRSLLFELRPTSLDRDGLVPAIRVYLEHTAVSTGWTIEVHDALEAEPDPDVRALLYRIVQEAVTNARKHAGAATLRVDVASAAAGVMVRVHDDGAGFAPERKRTPEPGHLGLLTMVERAELAGGWARIASAPGEGTTIECWLPLSGEEPLA
jgi:signal transduction histidine kinase